MSGVQESISQRGGDEPTAKRILIVDDDPDITLTFKQGLEAENEKKGGRDVGESIMGMVGYSNSLPHIDCVQRALRQE
jgi:CheY-like chemotaxis protein